MSPIDALNQFPDAQFVITSKRYEREMAAQLIALGVEKEKIFTYIAEMDMLMFVGR